MANFGLGIGAFMDGLTKGLKIRRYMENDEADREIAQRKMKLLENSDARAADQQTYERGITDRRMKLAEGADARAAETHGLTMQKQKADMEFEQSERAADAPLRAAKRKSVLTGMQDEEELRNTTREGAAEADKAYKEKRAGSVTTGKDASGATTYFMDGQQVGSQAEADKLFEQRHGTFMDAYRQTVVPRVQQAYLARGDVKSADAWRQWNENERVRKGIDTAGRLETAFRAGDWNRVTRHLNELAKNPDYMALDGHDISAEPIKVDGKTTGLKVTYRNAATNTTRTEELKDMEALHTGLMGMVNPASVFEFNKQQIDAVNAAKLKAAEEDRKNNAAIDLKRVESALRIGQERAKQGMSVDPKIYAKGVLDVWNQLSESGALTKRGEKGQPPVKMSHEEQMDVAERTYREMLARAGQQGARVAAPTVAPPPRVLMSRPPQQSEQPPAPLVGP